MKLTTLQLPFNQIVGEYLQALSAADTSYLACQEKKKEVEKLFREHFC